MYHHMQSPNRLSRRTVVMSMSSLAAVITAYIQGLTTDSSTFAYRQRKTCYAHALPWQCEMVRYCQGSTLHRLNEQPMQMTQV